MDLILFFIASVGMSHIMVDGSIFIPLKTWLAQESNIIGFTWIKGQFLEMMNCYQCSGAWSGAIISLFMELPESVFVYGCAGSIASMFTAVILMWIQGDTNQE